MDVGSRRALGSRYELQERLGSGAMGEVWRTLDRSSGDHVAAKLLRRELTEDPEIVGRFIQERSILLGLRHDNVVRVRDLVVEGDDLAIVMDLVTGSDVRAMLDRSGTCSARESVEVVAAVLDALAAAHAAGCLHRDVKPDNVLLAEGPEPLGERVRLSDFGIARLAQDSTVQATGLLGTPGYMPPELFSEGRFSGASDVYAAGVMLYELVAGRTPFAGAGTAHTVGFRHVTAAPPVLPVAPELWHVLDALLAKDPTVRPAPATAARMLRELPDTVLDAPALPPQAEPTEWVGVAAAAPSPVISPRADDDIDVGATNLKGVAPVAAPIAAQGEVRALAGGDQALVDGETNLARRDRAFEAPVLAPGAPTVEVERRRRIWVWVAVAAGLLVLGGGAYLLVRQLTGGGGGGSAAPVTVQAQPVDYATGLQVTREATYDASAGTIELDMTFGTGGGPLRGDVLQVMPALEGQGCPDVAWDVESTVNVTRSTGIRSSCPGQVVPVAVPAGGSQQVQATITADLGSDPERALESWLSSQADATAVAVDDPDVVGSTAYVLQRLAGIQVVVPSRLTFDDTSVPVRLYPQWTNGTADETNLMYDSSQPAARRTEMLSAVAGDEELRFNPGDSCDGAVYSGPGGTVVLEGRPVTGCTLTTTIGPFADLESNALTVVGPQS